MKRSLGLLLMIFVSLGNRSEAYSVQSEPVPTEDPTDLNWLQKIIDEVLWRQLPCPRVPIQLTTTERQMLNSLIQSAFLGKNIHFTSSREIEDPTVSPNDFGPLSIMMKRGHMEEPSDLDEMIEEDGESKVMLNIAHILPNGQVCFANQKLQRTIPMKPEHAEHFVDVINTFIKFMNHKYRDSPATFRYV